MKTPLCELAVKYGTDKVIWGYTPHYFARWYQRRHEVKHVLEIGICGYRDIPNNVVGASLFMWRDFFPNAIIYGIDNDGRFIFNDQDRIRTAKCDAYNTTALADVIYKDFGLECGGVDFIVDDCVHDPVPQINLLRDLWPILHKEGLYAMEDVCPYKLPNNDMSHMMRLFPVYARSEIIDTPKAEKLIFVRS